MTAYGSNPTMPMDSNVHGCIGTAMAEFKGCHIDRLVSKAEMLYCLDLYRKVCQPLPYNNEKK